MKAIILAAGYATRLYPLTMNKPKALLPIGNKPILNYITEQIETIDAIDEIIIVSNLKFYDNFVKWKESYKTNIKITVLNDNTTDDTNKLGAVGDMNFAIDTLGICDDILVMAGDNIFTFLLKDFYNAYTAQNKDCILVKKIDSESDLKRMANVVTDENSIVTDMVEKPPVPISNLAAFASYIYKKDTLPLIKKYLAEGNNPDAPGFFPSWLHKVSPVYAYTFEGECYDIGTPESYEEVNKIFS